ncbi:psbP domain-containing protein 7, chloroplastic [Impatiens glandulifera]|uniref:psbP domain-containing protein 7, chloroplastic n=1 Tax=Impatiens glandulifera TaxID=253017 RepID=UPI001FB13693|nr:psbP domain-containing protein 7, chloroplastic [Impatiens glandulifera]XP_047311184.1 psbP domain-containing protein 7, chloroplastic [Impatiens glandulifera]XP_047311185.1 psbP domain-containing protein 7, chloroplastic [Impatiens glandulifera]XP_047311186.1 psbP domain-containing protein 7, chloroplastic [Impatiens glandulifera]XP_047311187.1 psbP domain-containing protein 7, chloroplastic [Impatiens glandulifera]
MATFSFLRLTRANPFHRTRMSGADSDDIPRQPPTISPAEQFPPMSATFNRRLFTGIGSASVVAVGANFAGITSFLLGLSPETGRKLKLDIIYPIGGYSRCVQQSAGFEFIYPSNWVGDQRLLYRAAKKLERALDEPTINSLPKIRDNETLIRSEPVVAFGPPGSSGELNVSVIVSPVPLDFRIEAFGEPEEVGKTLIGKITSSSEVKGTLLKSRLRKDDDDKVKYYELEYRVESSSFKRHNIAVCCVYDGRLFTLNAQAPEVLWKIVESDFYRIANSFAIVSY